MRLRAFQGLVIVLLLAAALPPPRVTNALIAAKQSPDSAPSKKPYQSRARNRIGFPILVDACRTTAAIASGEPKARRSWSLSRRPEVLIVTRHPSPFLTLPGVFRLRC
jgi:hypothetical protein